MGRYVYVDNSNLWIEGKKISAVNNSEAINLREATENKISDHGFRVDLGNLYDLLGGGEIKAAKLYGSRPPQTDSLWSLMERRGFEPTIYDRSASNKEKKIDTQMVADIVKDVHTVVSNGDEIIIVAGDSDYVPAVVHARGESVRVIVYFWSHASEELKRAADTFISLNSYFDQLKYSKPMKQED